MSKVQDVVIYQGCEIKAVQQGGQWRAWFRTVKQAQSGGAFHPFVGGTFDTPEAAIAHLKSFLDQRIQTPWLFTESGKFLGRSLESFQAKDIKSA